MARPKVRDDLVALEGYHSPQVDVRVRLNSNEAPTPPPQAFRDALAAELSRVAWNRYPDRGATELREGIAAFHDVGADQVFAANGSNEVIQTLCLAYGGFGRTCAIFEPTYRMHDQIASLTGMTTAIGGRRPDLSLDVDEVKRVIAESSPAITFLCSPNNPTGMVEPPEAVKEIADLACASDDGQGGPGLLVVDEAYGQFAEWSALELIDEDRPLVVTRTYSKTWSMAAARLGYLIGPSWLVAELDKVVLPYHLDAAKQIAGRIALRFVDEMNERVADLVRERERLVARLSTMPVHVWPSSANFVLFKPLERDGRDVWQALVERSILVRDTSSWPGLAGCLRVTIGTPDEDDAFLDALEEIL